jgi:hypothetical protein
LSMALGGECHYGSGGVSPHRDYVDARGFLIDDSCLHNPVLCIDHILRDICPIVTKRSSGSNQRGML